MSLTPVLNQHRKHKYVLSEANSFAFKIFTTYNWKTIKLKVFTLD